MKIAVQIETGCSNFSIRWVKRLEELGVQVVRVNCYSDTVIAKIADCDALMWHWSHSDPKAMLFAKWLVFALEQAGKEVFPNSRTSWHFDDKVGQKYLLEAVGAPLVPSHVFYDAESARQWLDRVTFPLVFKLKGGAGSQNVRLVRSRSDAEKLVRLAFGRGFSPNDPWGLVKDRIWRLRHDRSLRDVYLLARSFARFVIPTKLERVKGREKGYIYFQEYMPDNDFDTRIIVVGKRAFGIIRHNREGDFRASGSGLIEYDHEKIDVRCVQIAFEVNQRLNVQCLAYDFIYDSQRMPRIVEISYGFVESGYDSCPGYWDNELNWHEGRFNPQAFMVDDLIVALKCSAGQ